jgi:hypothetical protein
MIQDLELTEQERDQMAHAIGHWSAKGCSVNGGRNHYVTQVGDPLWVGLVARGLAKCRSSSLLPEDERVFLVTDEGRAAVDADPRTIAADRARGRQYAVTFRGYEGHPVYAYGVTRGKAKSEAARIVGDCYPDDDAYMQIVSCRLV